MNDAILIRVVRWSSRMALPTSFGLKSFIYLVANASCIAFCNVDDNESTIVRYTQTNAPPNVDDDIVGWHRRVIMPMKKHIIGTSHRTRIWFLFKHCRLPAIPLGATAKNSFPASKNENTFLRIPFPSPFHLLFTFFFLELLVQRVAHSTVVPPSLVHCV